VTTSLPLSSRVFCLCVGVVGGGVFCFFFFLFGVVLGFFFLFFVFFLFFLFFCLFGFVLGSVFFLGVGVFF